ncbi:hypothetical protein J7T55_015271 [Diaporthe amygdali]|uniref:uncharacterized protein n=1 Tax=Phomopsis amygdali TaxID=1214568 RepID=UPI0022FE5454|nr:uncharacterized protein J7T55_015271 [Diaporthe amygdali]KAJ0120542.1 hypothetical protein J7T55_015271 [Diaporthe amygdali]
MAFGKLYTRKPNPRTTAILAVAKAQGLDLDIVYHDREDPHSHEELLRINPLAQVPVFVGADGYKLTECIPIALYSSSKQDYFNIIRWMSFANSDLLPAIGGVILPVIGLPLEVRMNDQDCLRVLRRDCKLLEDQLKKSKYLVGDQVTLADMFTVGLLFGAFMVLHKMLEAEYPRLTEWYNEVYHIPMFNSVAGPLHKLDIPVPTLSQSQN